MLDNDDIHVMLGELRKGQLTAEKEIDRLRNETSHLKHWIYVLSAILILSIFANPVLRHLIPALM
ncbi:hypothetical protein Dpep_0044 [Dethiosulfovibrio peptidovorans DSM 11002]|uniref:Uncharacterized protein n=1 Tax=Dethiosulfovibrio peptidovorans DSM 11002 TaxID=469381 RepID=D2Z2C0_9BACT|nr:hypothetical protein [Dethiosulfovibrio peptidovorans]EFC90076.1 hypothetical protein Dpep_0044 [Dethiosulfovibrio peptidovorans DSM 11002]